MTNHLAEAAGGILANAVAPLATPTYDGSGQVTHPDIVYFPPGWRGWEYWLVVTPYPGDDIHKENPTILVSHDGLDWHEPPGIVNPIALPGVTFLADGDMVYDPVRGELAVYYVQQRVERRTYVMRQTSGDGVRWGAQVRDLGESLCDVPDYELLSPAVVRAGDAWWMWSVNTGPVGCHALTTTVERRASADGLRWSAPERTDLALRGYWPWHLDVIYVPAQREFWALVSSLPEGGSCHNTVLSFARSADGLAWVTYERPALAPGGAGAWDCGEIYRSTLLYDAAGDRLRVWYAANDGVIWRLGYTEGNYSRFLAGL